MEIAEYEENKRERQQYLAMIAEQRAIAERDGRAADVAALEAQTKPAPRVYLPPVAGY